MLRVKGESVIHFNFMQRNKPLFIGLFLVSIVSVMLFSACDSGDGRVEDDGRNGNEADGDLEGDLEENGEIAENDDPEPANAGTKITIESDSVLISRKNFQTTLTLLPVLSLDERETFQNPQCEKKEDALFCRFEDRGEAVVMIEDEALVIEYTALVAQTLEGIALVGVLEELRPKAWLSNGFQSWSQSGIVKVAPLADEATTTRKLEARGDDEVMRTGNVLSWFYSYTGGGESEESLFMGALTSARWKPWVQVGFGATDAVHVVLANGFAGEAVSLEAGERISSERWMLAIDNTPQAPMERYGKAIPSRRKEVQPAADAGWNSWYELWDSVSEEDVLANAAIVRPVIEGLLGEETPVRIVIDDGWQVGWGDWTPNEKFPRGMDGLVDDLTSKGFEVGIWLAPLLAHEESQIVTEHPDWFAEGHLFFHINHGNMRVLDPTNPEAAAHLAETIERIVSWGFDFLKIDFLFAGTYEGGRHEDVTGMEAYATALSIIRQAAGEETLLLAVGAPGNPSFPFVDSWRLGADIAWPGPEASWYLAVNQARSVFTRWPLCLATLCDADPVLLREMTEIEVEFSAAVVALAGGALFYSDNLPALEEERLTWGLTPEMASLAVSGEPATPMEFFPAPAPEKLSSGLTDIFKRASTHVLSSHWRLQNGDTLFFNFTEETVSEQDREVPPHGMMIFEE